MLRWLGVNGGWWKSSVRHLFPRTKALFLDELLRGVDTTLLQKIQICFYSSSCLACVSLDETVVLLCVHPHEDNGMSSRANEKKDKHLSSGIQKQTVNLCWINPSALDDCSMLKMKRRKLKTAQESLHARNAICVHIWRSAQNLLLCILQDFDVWIQLILLKIYYFTNSMYFKRCICNTYIYTHIYIN